MQKVKELIWDRVGNNGEMAQTTLGNYFIFFDYGVVSSCGSFNHESRKHKKHSILNSAKDYCQKDFENRINENLL